jgi:hypothetical protein
MEDSFEENTTENEKDKRSKKQYSRKGSVDLRDLHSLEGSFTLSKLVHISSVIR